MLLTRFTISLIGLLLLACSSASEKPASNMAAARAAKKERQEIRQDIIKIEPFFKRMGKPANSDWLASHNEQGQTFDEFLKSDPVKPTPDRRKIYILPIGNFDNIQREIIHETAQYLEVFYGLPVEEMPIHAMPTQDEKPLVKPSRRSKRTSSGSTPNARKAPGTGRVQFRADYIIDEVIASVARQDAIATLGLTDADIYSADSGSYVFGQTSFEKRLSVVSLSRLATANRKNFEIRLFKIASHETGHIFGMRHCTKYECLMSGTNNLAETDRHPLDVCPECMAKIAFLSGVTPHDRYAQLADYCNANAMPDQAANFRAKAKALSP